jgi:hypothetical protein
MKKPITLPEIQALHALFCRLLPESACVLNQYREHEWFEWHRWRPDQPFTLEDLAAVVSFRRALIASKRQFQACLRFSYMIGRPDLFEEDLGLSRAVPKPPTDRDRVLAASGRPVYKDKPAKMAEPLVAAALNRLRASVQ